MWDLDDILPKMTMCHTLVVGDIMLDEFLQGKVVGLSPEAPAQLLRRTKAMLLPDENFRLGGAGNAARNVGSLGAPVHLVGIRGDDVCGKHLQEVLDAHNPDIDAGTARSALKISSDVMASQCRKTTHKMRVVDTKGTQLLRVDSEDTHPLEKEEFEWLQSKILARINSVDAIIISDYGKGVVTEDLVRFLVENKHPDTKIIVDPKDRALGHFEKYSGCDLILPNAAEFRLATGCGENLEEHLINIFKPKYLEKLGIGVVIITLGKDGVIMASRAKSKIDQFKGEHVAVADVTGASDTVAATVALVYWATGNAVRAARYGELAGRRSVTQPMTGTITKVDLLDKNSGRKAFVEDKIVLAEDLAGAVHAARVKGAKEKDVALVTGCFDILHWGHLHLLETAKKRASLVVVLVNDDEYIRTKKRPGGPFMDQEHRQYLIASLVSTDFVAIFSDDSPEKYIEKLRPEFLIMGQEYQAQFDAGTLPGMRAIEKYQIETEFVEKYGWFSSSEIGARIRNDANS